MTGGGSGKRGEDIAADHLRGTGMRIIARNWHAGRLGELDIVAADGDTLAFVEVKTASGKNFGDPLSWVGQRKQRQIARLAEVFLAQHKAAYGEVRFDVVAVNLAVRPPDIRHLRDAFRLM